MNASSTSLHSWVSSCHTAAKTHNSSLSGPPAQRQAACHAMIQASSGVPVSASQTQPPKSCRVIPSTPAQPTCPCGRSSTAPRHPQPRPSRMCAAARQPGASSPSTKRTWAPSAPRARPRPRRVPSPPGGCWRDVCRQRRTLLCAPCAGLPTGATKSTG